MKSLLKNISNFFIKKFIYTLSLTVIAGIFLAGCSKKSDDPDSGDITKVTQMLEGKWVFASYTKNNHRSSRDNVSSTSGSPGDYVTFANDGKVMLRLLGYDDVSTYSVRANNKLLFYGPDVFDIKTLSASRLELYRKDIISTTDYTEETFVFTR
ncbi:MAG: hypothetical protein WKF70_06315 [Chitinophagaceae bacterium]